MLQEFNIGVQFAPVFWDMIIMWVKTSKLHFNENVLYIINYVNSYSESVIVLVLMKSQKIFYLMLSR